MLAGRSLRQRKAVNYADFDPSTERLDSDSFDTDHRLSDVSESEHDTRTLSLIKPSASSRNARRTRPPAAESRAFKQADKSSETTTANESFVETAVEHQHKYDESLTTESPESLSPNELHVEGSLEDQYEYDKLSTDDIDIVPDLAESLVDTLEDEDGSYALASQAEVQDDDIVEDLNSKSSNEAFVGSEYISKFMECIHSGLLRIEVSAFLDRPTTMHPQVVIPGTSKSNEMIPTHLVESSQHSQNWKSDCREFDVDWNLHVNNLARAFGCEPRYMAKFSGSYNSPLLLVLVYPVLTGIEALDSYQMMALPSNPTMRVIGGKLAEKVDCMKEVFMIDRFSRKMKVPPRLDRQTEQEPWRLLSEEEQNAHVQFFELAYSKSKAKVSLVASKLNAGWHAQKFPNCDKIRLSSSVRLYGQFAAAYLERDENDNLVRIALPSYHPEGIMYTNDLHILELLDDVWCFAASIAGRTLINERFFAWFFVKGRKEAPAQVTLQTDWNVNSLLIRSPIKLLILIVSHEKKHGISYGPDELPTRITSHFVKEQIEGLDSNNTTPCRQLLMIWMARGWATAAAKAAERREEWARLVPTEELERMARTRLRQRESGKRLRAMRQDGSVNIAPTVAIRAAQDQELATVDSLAYVQLLLKSAKDAAVWRALRKRHVTILEERAAQGLEKKSISQLHKERKEAEWDALKIKDPKKYQRRLNERLVYAPTSRAQTKSDREILKQREEQGLPKMSLRQLRAERTAKKKKNRAEETEWLRVSDPSKYKRRISNERHDKKRVERRREEKAKQTAKGAKCSI